MRTQVPAQITGRNAFVILGTQRGGTLIHWTDEPMYVYDWRDPWTTEVTALCGQHTHNAVPYNDDDAEYVHPCPKCERRVERRKVCEASDKEYLSSTRDWNPDTQDAECVACGKRVKSKRFMRTQQFRVPRHNRKENAR